MTDTDSHAGTEMQLPLAAIAALQQGNKIEAIKIIRQERGIGLKEAKMRWTCMYRPMRCCRENSPRPRPGTNEAACSG